MEGYYVWGILVPPYGLLNHNKLFTTRRKAQEFLNKKKEQERLTSKNKTDFWFARPFSKVVKVVIEYEGNNPDEEEKFDKWWDKYWEREKKADGAE